MRRFGTLAALALAWSAGPVLAAPTQEALDAFERDIRPLLLTHCVGCHGPKLQHAGFRLDTAAAVQASTDTGRRVIVPGDPEASSLIRSIRFDGRVKMPPAGKLPAHAVEQLTRWVREGAAWPADRQASELDPKKHWAFRPVKEPPAPAVRNKKWVKSPIDAFVLDRLERRNWKPAASADRYTLIRRATFDLTGLPPTAADVKAFVDDRSPTAFAAVVDRLLASPRYGERWGRHWLDVARYSDTKGYVFQEERRFPYSYTYRDWVIRALNEDLPYDRFVVEQLAADRLELGEDRRPLAAMGFLTLGRRFLNNVHDIVDDRLDVIFRGTQALTIGCARCHDHKYDPISMKDYYAAYGVLRSASEPKEFPLIEQPERTASYLAFEAELKKRQAVVRAHLERKHGELLRLGRSRIGESLMAAREVSGGQGDRRAVAAKYGLPLELITRWAEFLAETRKSHHPIFAAWFAFAAIPDASFGAQAPQLAVRIAANAEPARRLHGRVAAAFQGAPPASLEEVARRLATIITAPGDDPELQHLLDSLGGPLQIPVDQVERYFNRAEQNEVRELRRRVDQWQATSPHRPDRAMSLEEAGAPFSPYVFQRGNPGNRGPTVPRRFLELLSGPSPETWEQSSGRLEMARAIASPQNPLTARVMVNRVWGWHFGRPLVRTPSDFGLRSDPPSHPELLDYLAARFMAEGWSLKRLHRTIMLSSTYQQSSDGEATQAAADPEGALLWRYPRRRLDFESLRDSMLHVSGRLDLTPGGPSVDISGPDATRRTVYAFVDRQNLPGMFRAFDFAGPDTHAPQRFQTTVPQQSLFLLNHPFAILQAKALAARPEVQAVEAGERIAVLYRLALARDPRPEEAQLGLRFIQGEPAVSPGSAGLTPWERYAQALLLSNDFAFVD